MHDYTANQTTVHGERVLIGNQLKQPDMEKEGLNISFMRESERFMEKLAKRRNGKKPARNSDSDSL